MAHLLGKFQVSLRQLCGVVRLNRSTWDYRARPRDDTPLRMRLRELAQARPGFGYQRLHILLRREGWRVNRKRVHRLYREEGLLVRRPRRRKRVSHLRGRAPRPEQPNQQWSMDFVSDTLVTGRRFRALTVIDNYTRECQIIEVALQLTGTTVVTALDRVGRRRGYPARITMDNGSEFSSHAVSVWASAHGVQLEFIRPGKPVENALIESFNGRFRAECLNTHVFVTIHDARQKIERWRIDYNEQRPHGALGQQTPAEFARRHRATRPQEQGAL